MDKLNGQQQRDTLTPGHLLSQRCIEFVRSTFMDEMLLVQRYSCRNIIFIIAFMSERRIVRRAFNLLILKFPIWHFAVVCSHFEHH